LFKSVEIALHRAQAQGRDCMQFYSDEMYQQVLARDQIIKASAALNQFQLALPLVTCRAARSAHGGALALAPPELGGVASAVHTGG
jgi:hypothetical protein